MLFRKHSALVLIKGWNGHLALYATDKVTNHSRLRQWFRRMLKWAFYHPYRYRSKEKVTARVWKPKAVSLNSLEVEVADPQSQVLESDQVLVADNGFEENEDVQNITGPLSQEQQEKSKEINLGMSTNDLIVEFENHPEALEIQKELQELAYLQKRRKYDPKTNLVSCPKCYQFFKSEDAVKRHRAQRYSAKFDLALKVRGDLLSLKEKIQNRIQTSS
jgi:hypothetical protein